MLKIELHKKSIRTRILVMVIALIAVIFLAVLTVFNLLVGEYIKKSVNEQLQYATQIVFDKAPPKGPPPDGQAPLEPRAEHLPDMKRLPRGPMGKAEAIVVSSNYQLIFPDPSMSFIKNYDEMRELVAQLETEQIPLQNDQIMKLKSLGREYYFVSLELPEDNLNENSYLIYYIDMTTIRAFADRINTVLLAVMGVAGILAAVIAIIISGRIAQPIRELTRFAIRIGEGDFSKSNGNYRDIELSELAASMNKAATHLAEYDREQKTFFQNVSHELRTPLQVIKCNAEGIENEILDYKKSSGIIISETDRLAELVDDLLYISRIDNITNGMKYEENDLREILSSCAERQRSLATDKNIEIVFKFADQPVNFNCDEKHISRAFSNIISNAIRYAKNCITLYCSHETDGIIVAVADDGIGIPEGDIPHIFDRFYKGKDGKHGIGLAIVKAIIEQHGGKIEVVSGELGTTFTMFFPEQSS